MNVSGYGLASLLMRSTSVSPRRRDALYSFFSYPILGLYTDNVSAPLHARAGLRQAYGFGLYSYCAYVNESAGLCTNDTISYKFQPCMVITNDMLSNYSDYTNTILGNTAFANSSSFATSSRAGCYLLLVGFILLTISIVMSVRFRPPIFCLGSLHFVPPSIPVLFIRGQIWVLFVSASASILGTISIFAGSTVWTAIIKKANDVNSLKVQPAQLPLGIKVSAGGGLASAWIAVAFLIPSTISSTLM